MRRRHRGGRLCKGRARQGGVSSTSDGWRRQRQEVRDATCAAPPLPLPPGTTRRGPVRPLLCSGDPLAAAPRAGCPASILPARAQPGLVYSALLAAAGGPIPALGPILQMEKLTQEP